MLKTLIVVNADIVELLPVHSQERRMVKTSKRAERLVTSIVDALRLSKNYRHYTLLWLRTSLQRQ